MTNKLRAEEFQMSNIASGHVPPHSLPPFTAHRDASHDPPWLVLSNGSIVAAIHSLTPGPDALRIAAALNAVEDIPTHQIDSAIVTRAYLCIIQMAHLLDGETIPGITDMESHRCQVIDDARQWLRDAAFAIPD